MDTCNQWRADEGWLNGMEGVAKDQFTTGCV